MPRYTFSMRHGGIDLEPVETHLPDLKAAWAETVRFSAQSLNDLNGQLGMPDEWLVTVSDETGNALFELRCTSRLLGRGDLAG